MMEQRTLDIIRICKGGTSYGRNNFVYDAIRNYMADECMDEPKFYTDEDVSSILWDAMSDYLDHCAKPSFFMWCLKDVMRRYNWDIYHAIPIVFGAHTQVRNNGVYVNGFDDRLHRLDREEVK